MAPSLLSSHSDISCKHEVIFARGSRATLVISRLTQIVGLILFIISFVKSIFGRYPDLIFKWELFLVGLSFFAIGNLLRNSKRFQNLLSIQSSSYTKKRSLFLRVSFVILLSTIVFIRSISVDVDAYKAYFFGEGGLVEWSQVLFLLISIRLGMIIINEFYRNNLSNKIRLIYQAINVILSLVVLEELAWGQVVFGWKTPNLLAKINAQGETTLHNLSFFQNILDTSFFFVTLFIFIFVFAGTFLSSLREKKLNHEKKFLFDILLPPSYLLPLFLAPVLISFFIAIPLLPDLIINRDQEWAEILLYIGIFLSFLRTYILLGGSIYGNKVSLNNQ